MNVRHLLAVLIAGAAASFSPARAEVTNCQEITSLPAQIITQGVHCLKRDLSTSTGTGNAIEILVNNVTIDLNGFKLGGLAAGTGTSAVGIRSAHNRQNITIRNGTIRGFHTSVMLTGDIATPSGHLIEQLRIESSRVVGIYLTGSFSTIRNTEILRTGYPASVDSNAYGIFIDGSQGVVVRGNIIRGMSSAALTNAIYSSDSKAVVISDNDILDIGPGALVHGIAVSGYGHLIVGNRLVNATPGTYGIIAHNGDQVVCANNLVVNYSQITQGCTTESGTLP